jgi:uroporphyrinogen decarboxylase
MSTLTKRERVDAALHGQPVDRVPVAAWKHFIPEERSAATLADASLAFFQTFDWDWLKVNPRATYYAEAWGARYDFDDYNSVLPRIIEAPTNLAGLTRLSPTAGVFGEHLELLQRIKAGIGAAHFIQTVFSPLSVLHFLLASPADPHHPASFDRQTARLHTLLNEQPEVAHAALAAISETLAGYAQASVDVGASGIFFAIVRLARAGVLTVEQYQTFGQPYDLQVLKAVQGAPFNLLHICGPQVYFDQVVDYPVHALNWGTVGQGNPSLHAGRTQSGKAVIGGIDEHAAMQHGQPTEVIVAAKAALSEAGTRGILLTPGCGLNLDVPTANLYALRQAVEVAA